MAETSRKGQLTAELLQLTEQQPEALEDATFLGWQPGQLDAYQERGDRVSMLRQQLSLAVVEEKLEVAGSCAMGCYPRRTHRARVAAERILPHVSVAQQKLKAVNNRSQHFPRFVILCKVEQFSCSDCRIIN